MQASKPSSSAARRPSARPGMAEAAILRQPAARGTMVPMDERDVTLLMEVLFDVRSRIVDIHEDMFPPEDDDGEAEEEEDA